MDGKGPSAMYSIERRMTMSGKTYRTWNGDLFYHICEDGKISRGVGG